MFGHTYHRWIGIVAALAATWVAFARAQDPPSTPATFEPSTSRRVAETIGPPPEEISGPSAVVQAPTTTIAPPPSISAGPSSNPGPAITPTPTIDPATVLPPGIPPVPLPWAPTPGPYSAGSAASTGTVLRPESELKTWWHDRLVSPLGPPEQALEMQLELAAVQALANSARVSVLRETAAIATTALPQAEATFDPVAFLDTKFTDTSDPVGSTLTTGGRGRFIDHTWYSNGGLRKQALSGAQIELAQRVGFQNTNSQFFVPKDQATAKLMLNITQPLLRGAGRAYNNGVVVLATVDIGVARAQYFADLQDYLAEFHAAYWNIYLQRAVLLQRRRLLDEARAVLQELEVRRDVDVQVSQLARARAAVGSREAALLRYQAEVKNAVSRFKAIVNDPYLDGPSAVELVPLDPANAGYGTADLDASLKTALAQRPEIAAALEEIRGATQQLNLAKNEVLPMLNFVVGGYVYGLQGQSGFSQAFAHQFDQGRPTYWGGILYERPIGNRAPRAVRDQKVLELQRATSKLRSITAEVRAEVEIAVREIDTTRGEMVSRYQAMLAEEDQVNYMLQRWRLLAADQQVAGVVFNDLLDAQDRRAAAEFEFVTSQVAHRAAWVKLRRATGALVDVRALTPDDLRAPVAEELPEFTAEETVVSEGTAPAGTAPEKAAPLPQTAPPQTSAPSGEPGAESDGAPTPVEPMPAGLQSIAAPAPTAVPVPMIEPVAPPAAPAPTPGGTILPLPETEESKPLFRMPSLASEATDRTAPVASEPAANEQASKPAVDLPPIESVTPTEATTSGALRFVPLGPTPRPTGQRVVPLPPVK